MTAIPSTFRAYVAERGGDETVERGVRTFEAVNLPDGEVDVRVDWSSVNYKDALATIADGRVARISPLIPGIDIAGEVVASRDPDSQPARRSSPTATTSASPATVASASTRDSPPPTSCRCRTG